MKKSSYARIIILVLSLALLIGSVMAITAMADGEADGTFGNISVAYGDKVFIRVEVKATEDQIKNGNVVVSYRFANEDETEVRNATYYDVPGTTEGYVWVITEGIAAYDMAREVVFTSSVGENEVEPARTYSVAQFLYKMLYTESTATEAHKDMYKALLEYGRTAQIALEKNTDKMINASTLVTGAEGITFGGKDFAFVPGASAEVTPEWANTNDTVIGWTIKEGETTKEVGLTFECSGIVEVVAPILGEHVDTVKYEWAEDNSYCKAYVDCDEHPAYEIVYITKVGINVTATNATYTYVAQFENELFEDQVKTVDADYEVANGIATVQAPAMAELVPSHDYVKFNVKDAEATYDFSVIYSELDVWDGVSVSEGLAGAGTVDNPFLIQSAADFVYFANTLNAATVGQTENFKDQYVKMTVSVDLNNKLLIAGNHSGWNKYQGFGGTFDGNNCTIRNINVQPTTGTSAALFGCITKAGTLINLSVYGKASGAGTVGGVVAYQLGKVDNVTSYVTVTATAGTIGGVVANQENSAGAITNCVNYGSVTTTSYIVGGITGSGGATITGCTNWGSVQGGDETIGGIAGTTKESGTISGCYNYGSVKTTATDKGYIGGIVGNCVKPVSDCYNFGEITGANTTGGIVGTTKSAVTNCYNYGTVNATSWNIGGVVGTTTDIAANVSGCKNYGAVTSTGDCVGGIVGSAKAAISNCENFGTIKGTGRSAGIAYWSNATIENCTNNGDIIGGWDLGGILAYLGDGQSATITNCRNNGNITGSWNNGGIFGLAHENAGTVTITGCTNNGNIVSTTGGQITIAVKAVITDCTENGSWTAAE